jgi:hypothetical protein
MAANATRESVKASRTVLARRLDFEHRHPEITIVPSGQNPSGLWLADWPGRDKDDLPSHDTCTGLLDYLEARFDRGSAAAPGETGEADCT